MGKVVKMIDYTHSTERMEIIEELQDKGWEVKMEKHYKNNYIELTIGKCIETI